MSDYLTVPFIVLLGLQILPDNKLENASAAYILDLITPLINSLYQTDNLDKWIIDKFGIQLRKAAFKELKQNPNKDPRKVITEFLIFEIIETSKINYVNTKILPWDIAKGISGDIELNYLLRSDYEGLLPVTIKTPHGIKKGEFKEEFVTGLLLSFYLYDNNSDYEVEMFGRTIPAEIMDNNPRYTYSEEDNNMLMAFGDKDEANYLFDVNGISYKFTEPEFLQGFVTGCDWMGKYSTYTNLRRFDSGQLLIADFTQK